MLNIGLQMREAVASQTKGDKANCVNGRAFASVEHESNEAEQGRHGDDARAKDDECVFHCVCMFGVCVSH